MFFIINVVERYHWLYFPSRGVSLMTNLGHSWTARGPKQPETWPNSSLGLIYHSSPSKLPLGIEYGFPMPPIISKCPSYYFSVSFLLNLLVSSGRRGELCFSSVQEHGINCITIDMQLLYGKICPPVCLSRVKGTRN